MSSLVIVALPSEDDYIHKISSEKVPHMTLLFLGDDVDKVKNLNMIIDFVNHAASTSLKRFDLEVDHRGTLGPKSADILFFSKSKYSGIENIAQFRSNLLKDSNIKTAYDSSQQFPEWIPHITLGFPETPAKEDTRDYPGINYVNFDRIAVWFGEYEGIEFPLKKHDWNMDVAMSEITKDVVDNVLSHYGKKGMKWGVRKNQVGDAVLSRGFGITTTESRARASKPQPVTVKDKGKKLKTSGGSRRPAHPDAIRVSKIGQVGKKSGLKALSDAELADYSRRLNLEGNAKRLRYSSSSPPKRFVLSILGQTGKNQASTLANDVASAQVKKHLTSRLVKTGALAAA